jgi:hypothetical protein
MKLGMILTGGGSDVIPSLLRSGGASSYFSFAEVPYSKESIAEILSYYPNKYACLNTASALANVAEEKLRYCHYDEDYVAVGSTAKLFVKDQRSDRENVAWVVVKTNHRTIELGIQFLVKYREEQEKILASTIKAVVTKEFNHIIKYSFLGVTPFGTTCPVSAKLLHLRW